MCLVVYVSTHGVCVCVHVFFFCCFFKLTITYYNYKQLLQLHKLQLATGGKLLLGEKGIVIIIRALKVPVPQDHLSIVGPQLHRQLL